MREDRDAPYNSRYQPGADAFMSLDKGTTFATIGNNMMKTSKKKSLTPATELPPSAIDQEESPPRSAHARDRLVNHIFTMVAPYVDLLRLIPGIDLEPVPGGFYCCGLGGIIGFKKESHESSLALGSGLMDKIREMRPDRLVTDCLSCRLQFHQLLPYEVVHPVEVLLESYLLNF